MFVVILRKNNVLSSGCRQGLLFSGIVID